MTDQLEIRMGAMAPSLVDQLVPYGMSEEAAARLERLSKAITALSISDMLPPSQVKACRDKLFKRIEKELKAAGGQS